jgi:hypothetical protein
MGELQYIPSGIRRLSVAMILRAAKDLHIKKQKESAIEFFKNKTVLFFCKIIGMHYDDNVFEKMINNRVAIQALFKKRADKICKHKGARE